MSNQDGESLRQEILTRIMQKIDIRSLLAELLEKFGIGATEENLNQMESQILAESLSLAMKGD